ncbi:MAG: hypothetical protein ACRD0L_16920, partial [Acidimicrobiales bacterium]
TGPPRAGAPLTAPPAGAPRRLVRRRAVLLLVRPTVRTLSWVSLGAGAGLAGLFAAFLWLPFAHVLPADSLGQVTDALRVAAVGLAFGAVATFDDPTERFLSSTPVSVLWRRAIRLALVLPVLALCWWGTLSLAAASPSAASARALGDRLHLGGLTLETAVMVVLVMGLAAVARRLNQARPAVLPAAGGLVVALVIAWRGLGRFGLFPPAPGKAAAPAALAAWTGAIWHWGGLGALMVVVVLAGSSDAWRRPTRLRLPMRATAGHGTPGRATNGERFT